MSAGGESEDPMKRAYSLYLAVAALVAIIASVAVAQEVKFSKPILIGGDNAADQTKTQSTDLEFFAHPAGIGKNFKPDKKIEMPGMVPIEVGDVAASPGAPAEGAISANSPGVDHLKSRADAPGVLDPLTGIGTDDFVMFVDHPTYGDSYLAAAFEYQMKDSRQAHRLIMADVRSEAEANEFNSLFGVDPLEEGLIGNAAPVAPYDAAESYPTTVVHQDKSFKWCLLPNVYMPSMGFWECGAPIPANVALGGNEYKDALMYDFVDIGTGLVGAVYDPVPLKAKPEIYMSLTVSDPAPMTLKFAYAYADFSPYAYFSPLALFRKANLAGSERYLFGGYTAYEMPYIDVSSGMKKLVPFVLNNWILPMAMNPIAIDAVDLKGASSWQNCGLSECSPNVPYPDTDLTVAYQGTLFDLESNLYDIWGRPLVMANEYHNWRWHLGTCETAGCADFDDLDATRFPDRRTALAMAWIQKNKWLQSSPDGDYVDMNPSHVFSPAQPILVGSGMYDNEVVTDYADDPINRHQVLFVPSGCGEAECPGGGIIYYASNWENYKKLWFKYVENEFTGVGPFCTSDTYKYQETPFIMPDLLRVERPAEGFVPYEVKAANLDGDKCGDFIVTWRGAQTVADPDAAGSVKFDDGASAMFSNRVSIVLRNEIAGPGCEFTASYPADIPSSVAVPGAQIASAVTGDFDGDGLTDIAVGNAVPELAEDGSSYSAYEYVLRRVLNFSTLPQDMLRVQVGFISTDLAQAKGVSRVKAYEASTGPDTLAQIVGRPLMLPDIGCPDYSGSDDPTVASAFENYWSVYANLLSAYGAAGPKTDVFNVVAPFIDSTNHPVPIGCASPKPYCELTGSRWPLYSTDDCCSSPCTWGSSVAEVLASACYDHLKKLKDTSCWHSQWLNDLSTLVSTECGWASNSDEGSSGNGDSDFAQAGRSDVIVGEGNAIARASDLIYAAAQQLDASSTARLAAATEQSAFPHVDLEAMLAIALGAQAEKDPQLAKMMEMLSSGDNLKNVNGLINDFIDRLDAPPRSMEEYFMQKIVSAAYLPSIMGKASNSKSDVRSDQKAARIAAGCSLIYEKPDAGAGDIAASVARFIDRLTDLFVKKAGAACGDGVVEATEGCDHNTADPTSNTTGAPYYLCEGLSSNDPNCDIAAYTCSPFHSDAANKCRCTRPFCGDGCVSAPDEACDTRASELLPSVYGSNNNCPVGTSCSATCECVAPPISVGSLLGDLKFPIGQAMPGLRELTAVVLKMPNLCNPADGVLNPGEQCDMFGTLPGDPSYAATVNTQCESTGNGPADICEINCTCYSGGATTTAAGLRNNDCIVQCATYPNDAVAAKYKETNDKIRAITGRTDDFICPEEQGVTVVCRVDGSSAPTIMPSELSLSLSGDPLGGVAGNVLPYSIIQSGGSAFEDETKLEFRSFVTVEQPIMLVPLGASEVPSAQVIVPNLASSVGAVPMTTTSVAAGASGSTLVNNMYSHRLIIGGGDGELSLDMAPSADALPGTAVTLHELKMRTVNTGGSWVAAEGATKDLKPVEDRIDWPQLMAMMDEKVKAMGGAVPTSAIYADNAYPVVSNQRYAFSLYQEKYATAAEGEAQTVDLPFGFIVGDPMVYGQGSGCGCFMAGAEPTLGSVLPIMLALLAPAGGIAYSRIRRRHRK